MKKKEKKTSFFEVFSSEIIKNNQLYILAIPVLLYFLIFCYLPMFGLVIAFKDYSVVKGVFASPWVGFKNFTDFFHNIYFGRLLRNTLLISAKSIVFGFPAPIILALLLNELRAKKFKSVVQTITYLPHFISMVVICGMIMNFFGSEGIVTKFIAMFGGELKNYMGDAKYFQTIYVATEIWQGIGWSSIIYLAALAGIDQQLYEAASIDGAGRFKQMLYVTLPGIAETVIVMLILRLGQVMSLGYEKIILLYNSSTYETADIISSFVYRMGLGESRYGFSAAVGLFQSIINIILLLGSNAVSKKINNVGLF